ncbi:MAG: ATP-binding protein [Acidimicrobiia bacterium]
MTLRLRLVIALAFLLTVGLTLFGLATYSAYSRSQVRNLDDQIRSSQEFVQRQLEESAGLTGGSVDGSRQQPRGGGDIQPRLPFSTYAELLDASGKVVGTLNLPGSTVTPKLPEDLDGTEARIVTTGSSSGEGRWRVYIGPSSRSGYTIAVAVPMGDVTSSLRRLATIEIAGGLSLLVLLLSGSFVILRRGLHPLESMASTAGDISAGDMSLRVSPSGGNSEVGQLGLALNSMLDEIQAAFDERDATEQKLRQFLADASHELRTPLTSIQGFAELFRLGANSPHIDTPTILRRIEEESARMKVLVEDLLLLARLDQTRPAERKPVNLTILCADACSDAVATAPDRPVTLDAPEPVVVNGDQAHLRQAIANLVTNALKHTPAGSGIEVGARVHDGRAQVTVRDHGTGLDGEALAHAFDRFWQADKARTGAGAGLGLSIVAAIAAEHGGTVTVENLPGGGARFTLTVPI